jgi:DNA-binding NtrC family response regulator
MSETTTLVTAGPSAALGRAYLVVLGDERMVTVPLPGTGRVIIGRSERADVRIDDPSISRQHAVLDLSSGMSLMDLGSANGTRIGDVALERDVPTALAPNEIAIIGAVAIVVQRRAEHVRARRIWDHDYIDGRIDEECARMAQLGGTFAVLHVATDADSDAVKLAFADALRELDVVGEFSPGRYVVMAIGVTEADANVVRDKLTVAFGQHGGDATVGVAMFPAGGRDAATLIASGSPPTNSVVVTRGDMEALYKLADRVAAGSINVLILGETGAGKQVLADRIHRASGRAQAAFVQLNCAAISPSLLESELFGHEEGAFTGAVASKPGLLETADGGTAFLDEIGDMPAALQAKLLRVIENQEVLRVGGLEARPIDVRFVAATNRDLEAEVARGAFRQDLYFRLGGVTLSIPPLRERVDEIEPLAAAFVAHYRGNEATPPVLSPEALSLLRGYSWPGNIRELRNAIERACLVCDGGVILPMHLPAAKMGATYATTMPASPAPLVGSSGPEPAPSPRIRGRKVDDEARRQSILDALMRTGGNNTEAARILGVSRRTLGKWCDTYGIPRPRKRTR